MIKRRNPQLSNKQEVSNVKAALRLLGIKVLGHHKRVIYIESPNGELSRHAVDITESQLGVRSQCQAAQFSGFCVRWNA